jgi:hypothetical protein
MAGSPNISFLYTISSRRSVCNVWYASGSLYPVKAPIISMFVSHQTIINWRSPLFSSTLLLILYSSSGSCMWQGRARPTPLSDLALSMKLTRGSVGRSGRSTLRASISVSSRSVLRPRPRMPRGPKLFYVGCGTLWPRLRWHRLGNPEGTIITDPTPRDLTTCWLIVSGRGCCDREPRGIDQDSLSKQIGAAESIHRIQSLDHHWGVWSEGNPTQQMELLGLPSHVSNCWITIQVELSWYHRGQDSTRRTVSDLEQAWSGGSPIPFRSHT